MSLSVPTTLTESAQRQITSLLSLILIILAFLSEALPENFVGVLDLF
jgi:hypothetical protein